MWLKCGAAEWRRAAASQIKIRLNAANAKISAPIHFLVFEVDKHGHWPI